MNKVSVTICSWIIFSLLAVPLYAVEIASWENFVREFISSDGRVIDRQQDMVSHSEGQGYGMLLAWAHNDRTTFERIWNWTDNNLTVRGADTLFAWKWGKHSSGVWRIIDYNNATDGDTLIAYALFLAADKWQVETYRTSALTIVQDIRRNLVTEWNGKILLLPGYYGFADSKRQVLNPSYFIYSAYTLFARFDDAGFWHRLRADSLAFVASLRFSSMGLPPDWLLYSGDKAAVYKEKSDFFGPEAIRIPLYLSWTGTVSLLPGLEQLLGFVEKNGYVPSRVDVVNNLVALDEAPAGYYAVLARAASLSGKKELAAQLQDKAVEKLASEKENYYSYVLYLLAQFNPG